MSPFVVAIDFDGTIVENEYPNIGPLKENAIRCIRLLKEIGCYIIITSCRTNTKLHPNLAERLTQVRIIKDFLERNNIPFDEIDDGSQGKVFADVYIDDRAVRFENNWEEIVRIVNLLMEGR
jgi:hypothetical protein